MMESDAFALTPAVKEPAAVAAEGRLYRKIVEDIAYRIAIGTYPAGLPLPIEKDLTSHYSISRTVLREAIRNLEMRGVVEARQGAGTYPLPFGRWDVLDPTLLDIIARNNLLHHFVHDLLDMRRIVEAEAAALASERASDSEIRQLGNLLERLLLTRPDLEEYLVHHSAFHLAIVSMSHSALMQRYATHIEILQNAVLRRYFYHIDSAPGSFVGSYATRDNPHSVIFACISERRPERARAAMLTHVQSLERMAAELFKTSDEEK